MTGTRGFIDFAAGDQQAHAAGVQRHEHLKAWLASSGSKYGLPDRLQDLDDVGRETLLDLYTTETQTSLTIEDLAPPRSLRLPRLRFDVSSSAGLKKTSANFLALLADEKKLVSKRAPNPPLRYQGTPVFRIEADFVAQTGDVTRRDGSGGESIYGGTFKDEPEGLKTLFQKGTLAMANSGKNCELNLSSLLFFVTLADDPAKLKKLTGRYVAFGQVDLLDHDSARCLDELNALADGKGGTAGPVWIEECGIET